MTKLKEKNEQKISYLKTLLRVQRVGIICETVCVCVQYVVAKSITDREKMIRKRRFAEEKATKEKTKKKIL